MQSPSESAGPPSVSLPPAWRYVPSVSWASNTGRRGTGERHGGLTSTGQGAGETFLGNFGAKPVGGTWDASSVHHHEQRLWEWWDWGSDCCPKHTFSCEESLILSPATMFSFDAEQHQVERLEEVALAEVPFVKVDDSSGGTARSEHPAVAPASAIAGGPGQHPVGTGKSTADAVRRDRRESTALLEGMLHVEGMGPVDVRLTAELLLWHRNLAGRDTVTPEAMAVCCWPSQRPKYGASIPVSEIYAVELCGLGDVSPRPKPAAIGRCSRRPAPAPKMYRFVVHTFDRCRRGSGRWIPREIVFGHGSLPQCSAWVNAIRQLMQASEDRPRQLLVIVNPYGGSKMALQTWESVQPIFEKAGVSFKVVKTEYFRHAFHMMEQASSDELAAFDGVIIVGGDGLFNEVLNGLLKTRHVASFPQQPKPPAAPPAKPHPTSSLFPLKHTLSPSPYPPASPTYPIPKQSTSSTTPLPHSKARVPSSRSSQAALNDSFLGPSSVPSPPVAGAIGGYAALDASPPRLPIDHNPLLEPEAVGPLSPRLQNGIEDSSEAPPFSFTSLFASPFSYVPFTSGHAPLPTKPGAAHSAAKASADLEMMHRSSHPPPAPGSSFPPPSPLPPPPLHSEEGFLRGGAGVIEAAGRSSKLEHRAPSRDAIGRMEVTGAENGQPTISGKGHERVAPTVLVESADGLGTPSISCENTPSGMSMSDTGLVDGVRWPSGKRKLRIGLIPAGSTDAVVVSTTGARDPVTSALHIVLGDRMPLDIVRLTTWTNRSSVPSSQPSSGTSRTVPGHTPADAPSPSAPGARGNDAHGREPSGGTIRNSEALERGEESVSTSGTHGSSTWGSEERGGTGGGFQRDVRYAASFAGYGFYGDVMQDSEALRWMGPMRYDWSGFWTFLKHDLYEAEVVYLDVLDKGDTVLEVREVPVRPPSPASIRALDDLRDIRQRVTARSPRSSASSPRVPSALSGSTPRLSGQSPEVSLMGSVSLTRRPSASPGRMGISPNIICRASCNVCKSSGDLLHLAEEAEALEPLKRFGDVSVVPEKRRRESCGSPEASLTRSASVGGRMEGLGEVTAQTRLGGTLGAGSGASGPRKARWRKVNGKFHSVAAVVMSCRQGKSPDGVSAYAHLADGNLDLVLIRECSHFNYLRQLISLTQKGVDPFDFSFVEHHKTPMFSFSAIGKRSTWNVDGELVAADQLVAQVFRGLVDIFARGPEN